MPTTVATPADVNKVLNAVNAANVKIATLESELAALKLKDGSHDEQIAALQETIESTSQELGVLIEEFNIVKIDLEAAKGQITANKNELLTMMAGFENRMIMVDERLTALENPTPPIVYEPNALYVPLFIYPGAVGRAQWQRVADLKAVHVGSEILAAINPNNGIFTSANADFTAGINILVNSGILVLGYVYTKWGNQNERTLDSIKQNILAYRQHYPQVRGLFLDEMASSSPAYYREITEFAKENGIEFVMGNPGTAISESSIGSVDTSLIYEVAGLPSLALLDERTFMGKHASCNFGAIPYQVSQVPNDDYLNEMKKRVKYIYITSDTLSNPWDTLPPYFEELAAKVFAPIIISPP